MPLFAGLWPPRPKRCDAAELTDTRPAPAKAKQLRHVNLNISKVHPISRLRAMDSKVVCGVELPALPNLVKSMEDCVNSGFDFMVVPLAHPRNRREYVDTTASADMPPFRSDLLFHSGIWTTQVIGKLSPWLNLDSTHAATRLNSEKAFKQELAWSTHLSLPSIIMPTPSFDCGNYARVVYEALAGGVYLQMLVQVPLLPYEETMDAGPESAWTEDYVNGRNRVDTWERWNKMRTLCDHHPGLCVALELTPDLPSEEELKRWLGEPVKVAILPTSIFIANKKGFPVLSKRHQQFLFRLFRLKVQVVVSGMCKNSEGALAYLQYVTHLWRTKPELTESEAFEAPYWDYLQAPLQPLADNLESQTYETFERDPVKYVQYEKAVAAALTDRFTVEETAVVMVVGAGRGPLVRASLRASTSSGRNIRVYAVEKNPNAVVTLKNMKISEGWGDRVTIAPADMREWVAPEKADILVSELLGSFGDNELSPECLDGAQKFLKEGGISIPCDYTAYIAPLSTSKLWNDVKNQNELKHFETAYVVSIHNADVVASPKPCWVFTHPNPLVGTPQHDNSRHCRLSFKIENGCTIHGFAGYFHSTLYGEHCISIEPSTFSTDMFSWFPIYVPIKTPVYVPEGSTIECEFWRVVGKSKVWYEWALTAPEQSSIHNPNGRSYWIGL